MLKTDSIQEFPHGTPHARMILDILVHYFSIDSLFIAAQILLGIENTVLAPFGSEFGQKASTYGIISSVITAA